MSKKHQNTKRPKRDHFKGWEMDSFKRIHCGSTTFEKVEDYIESGGKIKVLKAKVPRTRRIKKSV